MEGCGQGREGLVTFDLKNRKQIHHKDGGADCESIDLKD